MSDHKPANISCDQILGLLTDYLDGQTREEVCREIEQHMSECHNCRVVVDTTRKTISLVHANADTPLSIPEDVRERLFKRLDLDDYLKRQNTQ
jgi:predicted anti-sigma-YlaC factor YlaD